MSGWLNAIIESAEDAIISKTLDGILTSWNKGAEHIFGYTFDEIVGRSVLVLIPDDHRDEEAQIIAKIRNGERVEHFETIRRAKDGRLISVSLTVSPIKDADGNVIGASKILRDVTRQKEIEEERRQVGLKLQLAIEERDELLTREQEARQQSELANRAKDEFLGLLSHELRTPLNSILGWTRLLSTENLDADTTRRAIETIDRNAKLQTRLIDDMLDVSRIISGKLRLDAQPVDLTTVINSAIDTLRPAAAAKDIRFQTEMDFATETVLGDPARLQQVLWNLLSNAIKFTPKGGNIHTSFQQVNSQARVTVTDSGPGIEESFLPFVFDRFRQADSTTIKKYGGLGLGLSIVRHLVELHGGTVAAANREDSSGAVFTLNFPVMAIRQSAERPGMKTDVPADIAPGTLPMDSMPRLDGVKILVVDDEPDARRLMTVLLEQRGAKVESRESVAQALETIAAFDPAVLVSDIGMPGEDGYSLIRKLRARETGSGKRLPAVALTAFARVEDRLQALSAGYDMHVPKPVEPAELILVISRLVPV
jgi:PAS domain S-box-containing protein